MGIKRIEDISDPRLADFTSLTDLQLRNRLEPERGIFIAESAKVVERALDAGYEPLSMLVPEHRLERESKLIQRVEDFGAQVFTAPDRQIEQLAGFELTRGVLCSMRRKPLPSIEALLENARTITVLEGLTNHTNVGAAFRNAAAFGVDAVFIAPGCSDPLYRRAVRVSMGNVFNVAWTRIPGEVESWAVSFFRVLRNYGFSSIALALADNALSLDDPILKQTDKIATVFGTEGEGLRKSTIEACDHVAKIPMENGVDSLNVAATTAVVFWELKRCGL